MRFLQVKAPCCMVSFQCPHPMAFPLVEVILVFDYIYSLDTHILNAVVVGKIKVFTDWLRCVMFSNGGFVVVDASTECVAGLACVLRAASSASDDVYYVCSIACDVMLDRERCFGDCAGNIGRDDELLVQKTASGATRVCARWRG